MKQKLKEAADMKNLNNNGTYIRYILFIITLGLLIITPFFRGMFFREDYLPSIIVIAFLAVVLIILQLREKSCLMQSWTDYAFFGLIIAYCISFIFGISKSGALDGVAKYFAAFMLYKIAFVLSKDNRLRIYLLDGIVLSGFVTALFSLLGSGGMVDIPGVFGWGDRLNGLYQYPNATASILGGIFMLNVYLLMDKKKLYTRVIYFLSASILMLTFLETRSRGAMLTLLAAWILAFLLSKAKDKLSLIIYTAASGTISFLFYSKIYSAIIDKKDFMLIFTEFLLAVIVVGLILEYTNKWLVKLEGKYINTVLIVLFVIFIAGAAAAMNLTVALELSEALPQRNYEIYQVKPSTAYRLEFEAESLGSDATGLNIVINSVNNAKERTVLTNNTLSIGARNSNSVNFTTNESTYFVTVDFINANAAKTLSIDNCYLKDGASGSVIEKLKLHYRLIPDDIAKKITEISLKTESSSERLVFVRDGMKIFRDYFLTGTGARGWELLYAKYQSYGYVSSEAHNYYLQTAIESGILGVIAMISLLGCLFYSAMRLLRAKKENAYLLIGAIAMIFELLSHAALDFDFSLYAIFLTLMAVIGWLSAVAAENGILCIRNGSRAKLTNYTVLTLATVFAIAISMMCIGIHEGKTAASLVRTDMNKAKKLYESAMCKSFYNSAYLMDYNQLLTMEAKKKPDKALVNSIYNNYKKVESNDPYEARYYRMMLNFYVGFGYFDDALALSDKQIEICPFRPESYENKANVCYSIIRYYFDNKDYKSALKYNSLILDLEKQREEANKRTLSPFEFSEKTKEIIEASKVDKVNIEKLIK